MTAVSTSVAHSFAEPEFAAVPLVMWTVPNPAARSPDKKFIEALLALVGRHCAETQYAS